MKATMQIAVAVICCLPWAVLGTSPQVKSVLPTGGQRGTELEVSFEGERLQDAAEILCYEPGIEILKINSATNHVVKAQLKISPDCALGEHHLRLRTESGLSELRTFVIGPYPVVAEVEPNNESTNAQKIALSTTVTGVIKNEDVDCFAVELKKGQRLSAEVEGMRLGRGNFDPRLALLDEEGKVLADADDTWLGRQDPFISLVAPKDGTYVLKLRDVTYGGADDCHYRLHIGTFPRPTAIFPLGGKAGETNTLKCFSEATGEFTQQVKFPDEPNEKFALFAELDGSIAPTPNWLRVSQFANVLAISPNQDREHATATELMPPLAFNGILVQKGQEDWFRFPATKGTPLSVNVYARRLRSPLDSVLTVFDSKGQSLASDDDAAGADSSLKFTPGETTNYFVRIKDMLGHGGRDFVYRIEVTSNQSLLNLKIPEVSRNDTQSRQYITVARGNRFATLISAKRVNFTGDLDLSVPELPEGVNLQCDRMRGNMENMPLVFEASAEAPIGCKLLDLSGAIHGTSNSLGHFHQDIELVQGPNNSSFFGTSVDKLCVAVTKEAPYKLRIVEPKVPLVQAGSMKLEVVAERAAGFDEPIEVSMIWNPPGISSQSEATIPKGGSNVFYQLSANGGAEARKSKIAVLGHANVEGGPVYVSSQLAELEVATPFISGKIETLWLNPGKTAKLTVNLHQDKPFEGKAVIRLAGLPDKVAAPDREITKDDQEAVFEVTADPKCSIGSHKNLFCSVEIKKEGEVIAHTIAQGGILRIVQPKKTEATMAGK